MTVPIYFAERPFHRRRQKDTVTHLPEPFRALRPPGVRELADHEANPARSSSLRGRAAARAARAPLVLNAAVLRDPRARRARAIYTWGKVPVWPRRTPYIVELDNPYVLTLYHNLAAYRRLRPVLRSELLGPRCAGIVAISEACRRTVAKTLGDDVARRVRRVYPRVEPAARPEPVGRRATLRALFVGTQFWVKGGRELCLAFERASRGRDDVALTVVSRTPGVVRRRFAGAPITFLDPVPRETVVRELLPGADLAVMPSLQESFGMFALEAVAAGVPTITTGLYALPEIVGRDAGWLLDDPLGLWRDDLPDATLWQEPDLGRLIEHRRFPELERALERALREAFDDPAGLAERADAARARHGERFAPERWEESLRAALSEFTGER